MSDDHEKKPHISFNEAICWVCNDCGSKNFNELALVESPEQREKYKAIYGEELPDEIREIPATVTCHKCNAEWSTCDHSFNSPIMALASLAESLADLDNDELGMEALSEIQANSQEYCAAVSWALELISAMNEEWEDPDGEWNPEELGGSD